MDDVLIEPPVISHVHLERVGVERDSLSGLTAFARVFVTKLWIERGKGRDGSKWEGEKAKGEKKDRNGRRRRKKNQERVRVEAVVGGRVREGVGARIGGKAGLGRRNNKDRC